MDCQNNVNQSMISCFYDWDILIYYEIMKTDFPHHHKTTVCFNVWVSNWLSYHALASSGANNLKQKNQIMTRVRDVLLQAACAVADSSCIPLPVSPVPKTIDIYTISTWYKTYSASIYRTFYYILAIQDNYNGFYDFLVKMYDFIRLGYHNHANLHWKLSNLPMPLSA